MMGFLSGFSNKLLNSDNFNPFSGFPNNSISSTELQSNEYPAIHRYAIKTIIWKEVVQSGAMLSQQIGHAQIRIQEKQRASESAMLDNWFGTARINGEELPFTTDSDCLEVDDEYHIVYERTELPTGEAGIRIHDVIS